MRTLVFCTSHNPDPASWDTRHGLWLRSLRRSQLYYDQLLIVDDASPVVPNWDGLTFVQEDGDEVPTVDCESSPVVLYRFRERLGRQGVFEFPGWYRSFTFAVRYGVANGFEKIIHIESDAHVTSDRFIRHLNLFEEGWFAAWSVRYMMPEIAIQAAAGHAVQNMLEFAKRPYADLKGRNHELLVPFTHIERQFVGDRHGEAGLIAPEDADYTTQLSLGQPDDAYWWIPPQETPPRSRKKALCRSLFSAQTPFTPEMIWHGWSQFDRDFCWMVGWESAFRLPPIPTAVSYRLRLSVAPCIIGSFVTEQRLLILLNGRLISDSVLYKATDLFVVLDPQIVSATCVNQLTFIHPNGAVPTGFNASGDDRQLSVALGRLQLEHVVGFGSDQDDILTSRLRSKDITFIQTSDALVYADMLYQTGRTVRLYCSTNDYVYESYTGVKRGYWPYQATFNRVYMLDELFTRGVKSWVVYMDADAFIVDMHFDLQGFLSRYHDKAFLATASGASNESWDVNAGVFFLNLGHPTGVKIMRQWKAAYEEASEEKLLACSEWYTGVDDQQMLHIILRKLPTFEQDCIRLDWGIINSPGATFIRQHLRAGHTTFASRLDAIEREVNDIMKANAVDVL